VAKKKEEPAKPAVTQLIFQAPSLPTPKIERAPKKKAEPKPERKERLKKETPKEKSKPQKSAPKEDDSSTRVEAKRIRRRDSRDTGRRRSTVTESEFLARRESVDRKLIVREDEGRFQIGVLEDGLLVEHYVTQSQSVSIIGNVYLGKVQNVLPSMEAAFVDIGRGRNAVLYSGEVDWEAAETGNQPRRIELA
jgi:ribonuclease E